MFAAAEYQNRRKILADAVLSGLVLLFGNQSSSRNYKANHYPFRQDSTFLYYVGIDRPNLTLLMDLDNQTTFLTGEEITDSHIIWNDKINSLEHKARQAGLHHVLSQQQLQSILLIANNQGRPLHFLPPYRLDQYWHMKKLLASSDQSIAAKPSTKLIKAVVAQRSLKSADEIDQIRKAHTITAKMHQKAMEMAQPGMIEREIAGTMEGIAVALGKGLAFPSIVSIDGYILHNTKYGNKLKTGDLLLIDAGAESSMHYAADVTRTIPVGRKFNTQQREVYTIVLEAQQEAIDAIKPGARFLDIHLLACRKIACGLKDIGLMKGDVEEAVNVGAHALFFPHGIGHMLGLDVHDMENFGENYVGYDPDHHRSSQFGLSYLRLAKKLENSNVVTVEPGIYFIPGLIKKWYKENKFDAFINYQQVLKYLNIKGIRVEDDLLVIDDGHQLVGVPVPKSIKDIEHNLRHDR